MLSLTQLNIFTAVLYCDVEPALSDAANAVTELVFGFVTVGVVVVSVVLAIFNPRVARFS